MHHHLQILIASFAIESAELKACTPVFFLLICADHDNKEHIA